MWCHNIEIVSNLFSILFLTQVSHVGCRSRWEGNRPNGDDDLRGTDEWADGKANLSATTVEYVSAVVRNNSDVPVTQNGTYEDLPGMEERARRLVRPAPATFNIAGLIGNLVQAQVVPTGDPYLPTPTQPERGVWVGSTRKPGRSPEPIYFPGDRYPFGFDEPGRRDDVPGIGRRPEPVLFQQESEESNEGSNEESDLGSKSNRTTEGLSILPEDGTCGLDVPRRIIGGTKTDIDEFPWLCLLQYWDRSDRKSHSCGGVLISKRYVLTAAHCTHGRAIKSKKLKLKKVRLGEWNLSEERDCQGEVCSPPVQDIDVDEVIVHEGYKPEGRTQVHDISLIRLRTEAALNEYVQPICLPFNIVGNQGYEGKKMTVAGWGRTSNGRNSSSSVKMKVDLPIVNRDVCLEFYRTFYGNLRISKSQFCAGGEENRDTCQGDSGGPLMTTERRDSEIHWYLIGIVSSGPAACGVEGRPSLYTNVTQYKDWILENIRK